MSDKIVLKMVKYAPIKCSLYLPLPADLLEHKRFFLKICNYEDNKRCLVAEFHRQNKIPLTLLAMHSKEEENSSFCDYPRNSQAHEPKRDFVYPMGLLAIGRFEYFNEVQVNVFRLVAVFHYCFF